MKKITVGTIILDNDKLGIVVNVIESGCWKDSAPLVLFKIYEIRYLDGVLSMIREETMNKLIADGKINVISY